jgi:chaperone required for assembly of F1-ATPase
LPVKRFYKNATVSLTEVGHAIQLDGRNARTPARHFLALPTLSLAQAVAQEWNDQGEIITLATMPLTRLANAAIDGVSAMPDSVCADIVKFAGSDLLCYRAAQPAALVERQTQGWDPILAWIHTQTGASFVTVAGVVFTQQPERSLKAVADHIARYTPFQLTALHSMTTLTGSSFLALAVAESFLSAAEAWTLAHIDEDWINDQWGEDAEAAARRTARGVDMNAAAQFLALSAPFY